MNKLYDKYTKVVEADFSFFCLHLAIPTGASLSIVFEHYRLRNKCKDQIKKRVNLYFLSGIGMNKAIWNYHIEKLFIYSETHPELSWQIANCVAVDLVNHGESAVENEGKLGWEFDWREGSHDLVQVAKLLRLPGDNVLIGHSMGGFQTFYATTIAPLLFKFAVVIEPAIPNENSKSLVLIKKLFPLTARLIRSDFKDEDDFNNHFNNKSFYNNVHPDIKKVFFEAEKIIHRDNTVSSKFSKEQQLICYLAAAKLCKKLGKDILTMVPVPVVYITGANSKWNPPDTIAEVNRLIPEIESVCIKDGAHLVHIEQPDLIVKVFINSLNKYIENDGLHISQNNRLSKEEYNKIFKENYNKLPDMRIFNKHITKL